MANEVIFDSEVFLTESEVCRLAASERNKRTMKKKLLFLSLILAVILSVFAIGASAEGDAPVLKIEAANLSFEDSVYIVYAVSHEGVAAEDVQMLFWTEPQDSYTKGSENAVRTPYKTNEDILGKTCALLKYNDLYAKNMTDDIYAVAYAEVDGEEYFSEPIKYSILQYAYNKLGKTGTASENEDFKEMLVNMLAYGASAQKTFEYKTDRLADSDFYQVKVEGGTLSDGFTKGLFLEGEYVSLSAPATKDGISFSAWKNSAGNLVSTAANVTVIASAKNEIYTATYGEPIPYSAGLAFVSNGDGTCYVSGIGDCTDTDLAIPKTSPSGDTVTAIGDYAFWNNANLTSVVIPNTVFEIGDTAFYNCSALKSVILPDSITNINSGAFIHCKSLSSITIPDSVTYIGNQAFSYCIALSRITVGENNTEYCSIGGHLYNKDKTDFLQYAIGQDETDFKVPSHVTELIPHAFSSSNLETVYIPDSVISIDDWTFYYNANLVRITVSESNPNYCSIDGSLYSKDGTHLLRYATEQTDVIFTVPNSVTAIGESAFSNCASIKSIILPNSVLSIGDATFEDCKNLESLSIPASLTLSYSDVFAVYGCKRLTSILVDENHRFCTSIDGNLYSKDGKTLILYAPGKTDTSFEIPSFVTTIGDYAFLDNTHLESIIIPENVSYAGYAIFFNCENLTSVVCASKYISDQWSSGWNSGCNATITYQSEETEVTSYPDYNYIVFRGEVILTKYKGSSAHAVIPSTIDSYPVVEFGTIFKDSNIESIVIPEGITEIEDSAFSSCEKLTSVTIPSSVIYINAYAFSWCTSLTEVIIADNSELEIICENAFYNCDSIVNIEIPASVVSIGEWAFHDCENLETITIAPDSNLTSIYDGAFGICKKLKEFAIPKTVTHIGIAVFASCPALSKITVDNDNPSFYSIDGNLYAKDGTLMVYSSEKNEAAFNIPSFVTAIADYAFDYSNLTTITIPESVTSIGECAFAHCYKLNSLYIPSSVVSIGEMVFYFCSALSIIEVDEKNPVFCSSNGNLYTKDMKTLLKYAQAKTDTSFVVPSTVTTIGEFAFHDCSKLKAIILPDGLTTIENDAFENCHGLTDIILPSSVTSIDYYAFFNCRNLASIVIPKSLTFIGRYAFAHNALTSVYYTGIEEDLNSIQINSGNDELIVATRYYYSEEEPTENGNFWHYDENGGVAVWSKE